MNWLRRIIVLGLLSSLVILVLRRRTEPATTARPPTSGGPTWKPAVHGACPDGYPIKVAKSGIYHVPDGLSYARTYPERCYARTQDAESDGYRRAKL